MRSIGLREEPLSQAVESPTRGATGKSHRRALAVGCFLAASTLILQFGFVFPTKVEDGLVWIETLVAFLFFFLLVLEIISAENIKHVLRTRILEIPLLIVLAVESVLVGFEVPYHQWTAVQPVFLVEIYLVSLQAYLLTVLVTRAFQTGRRLFFLSFSVAATVAIYFICVILVGTAALLLPTATGGTLTPNISWVDALFTATSAVCVTGLIVVDTATVFSRFGQSIILLLIQLGGLGIMTYAAIFALGGGPGIRGRAMLRDFLSAEGLDRVISLLKAILITTLICELIGATALYGGFRPACSSATEALYASIFHSVSAFCNAGFSIFSNNLENFAASPLVNLPIIMLIVTGGIGFSVVYETVQWVRVRITRRAPYGHLSVHTRLVLRVTLVLILAGFVAVLLAGDWRGSSGAKIVLAGLFQSVTTRTAGLNTIPLRFLAPWCLVIFMLLMFIGGGSGGTAGGIKVSTVGLLYHSTKSLMKGRSRVEIMRRTISERAVNTAFVISGLAAAYVVCAVVALTWAHPQLPFFDLAFEVFSAFGTVGLSLGVTPQLSTWGKLIIIATMYLGRVGPLTVFIAMARRRDEALYEYPSATIVVG